MYFERDKQGVKLHTHHNASPGLIFGVTSYNFELEAQLMVDHLNKEIQANRDACYENGKAEGILIGNRQARRKMRKQK